MATETVLARWGNSLGLRLPRAVVGEAGLNLGDAVSIEATPDAIVIRKAHRRPRYALEELLDQVTPENAHQAEDWGGPVGRELL